MLNIQQFLGNEAGWQYLQDISLEENFKILEQVRNGVTVTTESRTKQEEVVDASRFWPDKREAMEKKIAEGRQACDAAFDRLINPEARRVNLQKKARTFDSLEPLETRALPVPTLPQNPEFWQAIVEFYQPLPSSSANSQTTAIDSTANYTVESAKEDYTAAIKVTTTLISKGLSFLPVGGSALSAVFSNYVGFLMFLGGRNKAKPNPFLELEKKLVWLIGDRISDLEANLVRNKLKTRSEYLNMFFRDHERALIAGKGKITDVYVLQDLQHRAGRMIDSINDIKTDLIDTTTGHLKVAPLYEHFFISSLIIIAVGEEMKLASYDFAYLRQVLYESACTFVRRASASIAQQRASDIDWSLLSESNKPDQYWANDRRFDLAVSPSVAPNAMDGRPVHGAGISGGYTSWYVDENLHDNQDEYRDRTLEVSKNAVGLFAAVQLLQKLCQTVDTIIQSDPDLDPSFNKSSLRQQYANSIQQLKNSLTESCNKLKVKFSDPKYIHPDLNALLNHRLFPSVTALDNPSLPYTVFQIPTSVTPIVDTYYYVVSKISRKVLDVAGGSTVNGANIQQYSMADVDQQKWKLKNAGDGYFFLVSKKSGRIAAVDVNGSYSNNRDNVIQYDEFSNADDQKWKLESTDDGFFHIVNKRSGKLLDVQDAKTGNGTNIQQYDRTNSGAQKWLFVRS